MQQDFVLSDNDKLKGVFDVNGNLKELTTVGKEFIKIKPLSNWRLSIKVAGEDQIISANDMEQFSGQLVGDELVLTWTGIIGVNSEAVVSIEWGINDTLLQGKISYNNFNKNCNVEKIHFPVVEFESDDKGAIILPRCLGTYIKNARPNLEKRKEQKYHWRYLIGGAMQFCAYTEDKAGIYFDTRDVDAYIKNGAFYYGKNNSIIYMPEFLVPVDDRCPFEYEVPYKSSIRPFEGSWHAAASIYKEWANQQKWYLNRNKFKHSEKVDDIGLWLWNRGRCETVIPPVKRLNKLLDMTIGLDWYWWHKKPYDSAYPDYLPPREGDKFKDAVAEMNTEGVFTQVYINGGLWDMDEEEVWKDGGEEAAIIKDDGTVLNYMFNTYMQRRLAYICGTSEHFRNKIREVARQVNALGLQGLYLDIVSLHSNEPCYSKEHEHTPGGGCYQVPGFRQMLIDIKNEFPELSLSSESCGEVYQDLLDTGIVLDPSNERFGYFGDVDEDGDYEVIPMLKTVYPDSVRLFGNYALIDGIPPYDELWPQEFKRQKEEDWQALYPDQFFIEIARNVAWGLQPTVANLREDHFAGDKFKKEIDFLICTARFYYANRDLLLWGNMLDPGKLEVDKAYIKFLGRGIFSTEEMQEHREKFMPAVLHSHWRNQAEKEALVLVNYTRKPQKFVWSNGERNIAGEIEAHSCKRIDLC